MPIIKNLQFFSILFLNIKRIYWKKNTKEKFSPPWMFFPLKKKSHSVFWKSKFPTSFLNYKEKKIIKNFLIRFWMV